MNTMISTLCIVTTILVSLHQTQAQASDLISQTCGGATVLYKDLCEKTLRSDPASRGADIHGLARIALAALPPDVTAVQRQIAESLKSSSDEHARMALKDCSENYDTASDQIKDSVKAMQARRYNDVNTFISAAMTNADSCEDGFKPGPSVLTKANENFSQLCSNVLAISNQAAKATA